MIVIILSVHVQGDAGGPFKMLSQSRQHGCLTLLLPFFSNFISAVCFIYLFF